jgi:maleylpyruvate isomerase
MKLSDEDSAARDALRARQGHGARYDAAEAPADDLLLARRATAFFARKLNELEDSALMLAAVGPAGWTRAHVVAEIGYDARRMALALEPLCPADSSLPPETHPNSLPSLDLAATLPARALRHLFQHSAIHLDVCWRDLAGPAWDASIDPAGRGMVAVRDLPRLRAVSLWRQVLALGSGATQRDVPEDIRHALAEPGEAR